MRAIWDWIRHIDASSVRSVLIRLSLVIMVVGSVVGRFLPSAKPIFEVIQDPLLWLTAYLVLSELISVRKSIEFFASKEEGFLPLQYTDIYQWTDYDKITLYLATDGVAILDELNKITRVSKVDLHIFIALDEQISREFPLLKRLKHAKISVTNFVEPSSFVILSNSEDERYTYLIGLGAEGNPVFLKLNASDIYAERLKKIINSIEQESTEVTKHSEQIISYLASEINHLSTNVIKHKNIRLINSSFFNVASSIVSCANKSVLAVDFISPSNWSKKPVIKKYAENHKFAKGIKQRVHVYDVNCLGTNEWNTVQYMSYLKIMKDAGVEVKFLELSLLDITRFETRGSTVIDEEITAIAINPVDGAPFGELNYEKSIVDTYLLRFHELWGLSEPENEFLNQLKKLESHKNSKDIEPNIAS